GVATASPLNTDNVLKVIIAVHVSALVVVRDFQNEVVTNRRVIEGGRWLNRTTTAQRVQAAFPFSIALVVFISMLDDCADVPLAYIVLDLASSIVSLVHDAIALARAAISDVLQAKEMAEFVLDNFCHFICCEAVEDILRDQYLAFVDVAVSVGDNSDATASIGITGCFAGYAVNQLDYDIYFIAICRLLDIIRGFACSIFANRVVPTGSGGIDCVRDFRSVRSGETARPFCAKTDIDIAIRGGACFTVGACAPRKGLFSCEAMRTRGLSAHELGKRIRDQAERVDA